MSKPDLAHDPTLKAVYFDANFRVHKNTPHAVIRAVLKEAMDKLANHPRVREANFFRYEISTDGFDKCFESLEEPKKRRARHAS